MEEKATIMTVLQELRDFRAENNKRWEENDKRWRENDKHWEVMENRVGKLEKGRIEDSREIFEVLDNMQRNIDNQFKDMKEYMELKFEKIDLALSVNNMEHTEFRKLLNAYGVRLDFYGTRLASLEKWRDEISNGENYIGVY